VAASIAAEVEAGTPSVGSISGEAGTSDQAPATADIVIGRQSRGLSGRHALH
jgi:hypothetical protein